MSYTTGPGPYPGQPNPQWGGSWPPPFPPPAKPGVIPLHPLAVGEILNGAFTSLRRYAKPLIGVMLAVQAIGIMIMVAAIGATVAVAQDRFATVFDLAPGEDPDGADVAALFLSFVPAGVLLLVVVAMGAAMIAALCPAVVQEAVVGRPTTFVAMWSRSWSRMPSVLGTLLLTGLIVGGPILVLYAVCIPLIVMSADDSGPPAALALLIPGVFLYMPVAVWLMTRFSLAPAVAVCEGLGPIASMRRSAQLVSGGWWRAFGISLVGSIVAGAIGYAIQMPFAFVGMASLLPAMTAGSEGNGDPEEIIFGIIVYGIAVLIGGVLSSLFQYGFPSLVNALLYVDLRMRKENLAEALIASAAAGATVTDAPAPAPASAAGTDER
ncbi:oxidoreductase [Streptomyces sp. NPDC001581]|uniref:oxidoreductase n=1 Tax=Streptomyces sp. NPDC001581 TaxID=3154386 RepID=UPI00331E76CD